jgi:hypothetical protein
VQSELRRQIQGFINKIFGFLDHFAFAPRRLHNPWSK